MRPTVVLSCAMFRAFAIVITSLLACVTAKVTWRDVNENYTFERYVEDFKLQYSSTERIVRKTLFEKELKRLIEHNQRGLSWKEGINQFSALSAEGSFSHSSYCL